MAKITIELNTHEWPEDIRILRAVADAYHEVGETDAAVEADRAVEEAEAERPTPAPAARKGRPRKDAPIAADPPPASTASTSKLFEDSGAPANPQTGAADAKSGGASGAAPSTDAQAADAPEVNLTSVNNKIHKLLDANVPALKLQEAIHEATDGRYKSANQAANANDTAALTLIDKAIDALAAAQ